MSNELKILDKIIVNDDYDADISFCGEKLGEAYHERNGFTHSVEVYKTAGNQYVAELYYDHFGADRVRRGVFGASVNELADAILDVSQRFLETMKSAFKDADLIWAKQID